MFEKKQEVPVGASAKIEAAERMKAKSRLDMLATSEGQTASQTIPVTFVFALAVGFAMLAMDGSMINTAGWHPTGVGSVDQLLVGSAAQRFTGDAQIDKLIVAFIRGFALCLVTGIIPLFAAVVTRMGGKGKINPLVACWGMLIAVPMFGFLIGPLLKGFL